LEDTHLLKHDGQLDLMTRFNLDRDDGALIILRDSGRDHSLLMRDMSTDEAVEDRAKLLGVSDAGHKASIEAI